MKRSRITVLLVLSVIVVALLLIFRHFAGDRARVSKYFDSLARVAHEDRLEWESLCTRQEPFVPDDIASGFARSLERRDAVYKLVDGVAHASWKADPRYELAADVVLRQITLTVGMQRFRELQDSPNELLRQISELHRPYYDFVQEAFRNRSRLSEPAHERLHEQVLSATADYFVDLMRGRAVTGESIRKRTEEWVRGRRSTLRP